jgi:formamidase
MGEVYWVLHKSFKSLFFVISCICSAREFKSRAAKAIWDLKGTQVVQLLACLCFCHISGIYATSRHIPGVRFAGIPHPGLIGTAPSAELLATWNKRESELIAQHANSIPPVAYPPEPMGAYVGQELNEDIESKIAKEGARTIPGREHGGNCDVSFSRATQELFVTVCK